eukprot:TRINITY_DN6176_c0_g1_i4.p1 TRINITY_DN6176_c0_g1~~TRINITY_DN6176_c0_g1_i4.p1  ORF type:complete len:259 (+),score=46.85 TRINITY_DN6176_c0_g1_i4:427-1203(+)
MAADLIDILMSSANTIQSDVLPSEKKKSRKSLRPSKEVEVSPVKDVSVNVYRQKVIELRRTRFNMTTSLRRRELVSQLDAYVAVNVLVTGESRSGKSSLIRRICDGLFIGGKTSSFKETMKKSIKIHQATVDFSFHDLQIEDIPGTEVEHYSNAVCIFMYDITKVPDLLSSSLFKFMNQPVPLILVGNKSDQSTKRKITTRQGKEMADELVASFLEISCQRNVSIQNLLMECLWISPFLNRERKPTQVSKDKTECLVM